jgi:large subunit ribosomal protein L31
MKKNIHPNYYQVNVVCGGCGANFSFGSTSENLNISICSECHPFYTGQQKVMDLEGRVDKFKAKYAKFQNKK